ncbi:DUF1707 SHOCT-like domain-containing protein [Streptomyces apricus]|uniref:DUF1707 domain-containing protein n=1 Tax=Streptomyces apricus TaxID=1828112 RepID=A0A5B0BEC1_9ACTN|nr:DUF1707 domain-containing protein [Streptomyces apricus]KAA0940493.1 DUF1707 domain-containing protein [Streptomyces apricus]
MTSLPKHPQPPVGDEERERAVRRLREAYAEEHISHQEMDDILGRVLTARTHGELTAALVPLPAEAPDTTSTIGALGGRIVRRGAWRVPRFLKVESAMGRVRLDLSRAVVEHPVVDIELALGTGRATITVPRDAVVNLDGLRTTWKDVRYRAPRHPVPGGPTVRVSGVMGMGRLKIRHARR